MRDILQVAEAGQPGNFVRKQSHPTVTWTFAADDSSRLSTCRGNLRSSTYDRISTSRSQESEGQNFVYPRKNSVKELLTKAIFCFITLPYEK